MRKTSRYGAWVCLAFTLAICTACIHKNTGVVTPWERVHTYNASFAEANNTVEKGAEAVVSSGLLPAAQAAPLIAWTGQVAQLHQQVTAILQQGNATQANVQSVQDLVDQIKNSVNAIPPASLGIKNPRSQLTFQEDVNSIFSLADAILTSLKAVKQ